MNAFIRNTTIISVILIAALIVLINSVVIIHENEFGLVKRFNRVEKIHYNSGIYLKTPFIENVDILPKQILMYNMSSSDVITRDKKAMVMDTYILWRITGPLTFVQTVNTLLEAERRIDAAVYNAIKEIIGRQDQQDAIQGRSGALDMEVISSVSGTFLQYGMEIIRHEVKMLDLPADNKNAVYTRMISEREQMAAAYSAEGREEAQRVVNQTDREVTVIVSEAEANAERIIAEGESEFMRILANAFAGRERAEFYEFIRSLDALEMSLQGNNKTLFLPIDSPLTRILMGY
jgi:membrane protease subunit HflC